MNDKRGWWVVFASMAALTVSSTAVTSYTQGIFLQPMTAQFGWSRGGYFLAYLWAGPVGALCLPVIGNGLGPYLLGLSYDLAHSYSRAMILIEARCCWAWR